MNRGLTALVTVVFLLVVGSAGLIYWLESTYDPATDPLRIDEPAATRPQAEATPPTATGDTAERPQTAPTETETAATDQPSQPQPAATETQPPSSAESSSPQPPADPSTTTPQPQTETRETRLVPAPQPDLVKQTPDGPLPVIAPDGRTPLATYARPHRRSGRPQIAIVLGNLGMSQSNTIAAIQQLPGEVTLAFHPYGRNLQDYVNQARAAGHEVLLEVPMEPIDTSINDPGPYALMTSLPTRTNLERLDWVLGRFAGYVGVLNFMGDRFTTSEPHLRPVLEAVRGRGLMFLDSRTSARSVAGQIAEEIGLPGAVNDRQIDLQASRTAIDTQLRELERLAQSNGQAVGVGYPYPVTIERLSEWSRRLLGKGIDLVPTSALVQASG